MSGGIAKTLPAVPAAASARPKGARYAGMTLVPAGEFWMGSDKHYPEEGPAHRVAVGPFWMDRHLVTNVEFKAFVAATGYVTTAELPADPRDYPGAVPDKLLPSSLVFVKPFQRIDLNDPGRRSNDMKSEMAMPVEMEVDLAEPGLLSDLASLTKARLSLLVIMWFATGITMMYWGGMPRVTPELRLERMQPVDFSRVRLTR